MRGRIKSVRVTQIAILILLFIVLFTQVPDSFTGRILSGMGNVMTVKADTGPKPSVDIIFQGLEGEEYYATLLSEEDSTGPYSIEYEANHTPEENNRKEVQAFRNYKDVDGYYFLGYVENCSETQRLSWVYYPPDHFKVLIYFPKTDRCVVSEKVYERNAFHATYQATYQVDAEGGKLTVDTCKTGDDYQDNRSVVHKVISTLLYRLLFTIVIELVIALLFGFRTWREAGIIIGANIVTQFILNLVLQVGYSVITQYAVISDSFTAIIWYLLLEIGIFILEAICYIRGFKPRLWQENTKEATAYKGKIYGYAAVANGVSFITGIILQTLLKINFL